MDGPPLTASQHRLRYLVTEMKIQIADAESWDRIHGVGTVQDEAEQLALELGFPGAPLKLIHHRRGEPGFERWIGADEQEMVEVLRFERHGPLGEFSIGAIGGLRPGVVNGKSGLIVVDYIFDQWQADAISNLEAWERAINGMRSDRNLPFRYPKTKALHQALGEVCRACAVYSVSLQMLVEPVEGASAITDQGGPQYFPPEQCLPPDTPEFQEGRATWEGYYAKLEGGARERCRRLDLYFVVRQEADEAAERCEAAADDAADELKDDRKSAIEQATTRVRAALAEVRSRVPLWYRLGGLLSPGVAGTVPGEPVQEADLVQGHIAGLNSLASELGPIAEQRQQPKPMEPGQQGSAATSNQTDTESSHNRREPKNPTRPISLDAAAKREWFGKMDKRVLRDAINDGVWAAKQISAYRWVFDLEEIGKSAKADATPKSHGDDAEPILDAANITTESEQK